jgi:hypothetical protein
VSAPTFDVTLTLYLANLYPSICHPIFTNLSPKFYLVPLTSSLTHGSIHGCFCLCIVCSPYCRNAGLCTGANNCTCLWSMNGTTAADCSDTVNGKVQPRLTIVVPAELAGEVIKSQMEGVRDTCRNEMATCSCTMIQLAKTLPVGWEDLNLS